jgi:hypothetical protein
VVLLAVLQPLVVLTFAQLLVVALMAVVEQRVEELVVI